MSYSREISIIIPTYNGMKHLPKCLKALSNVCDNQTSVVIVDNGSTDETVSYISANYPAYDLICLESNYGFSKAVNIGIEHSNAEFVILLNNDTEIQDGFVSELLKCIKSDSQIFSVSAQMLQMGKPEYIDDAGDDLCALGWGIQRYRGEKIHNDRRVENIFSACAGAAIYRKHVFNEIGYFDESFFAYLEDVDLGYRAILHGYRNLYCSSAKVLHYGSGTTGSGLSDFKVKQTGKNTILLFWKNMSIVQFVLNFPLLVLGIMIRAKIYLNKGFFRSYIDGVLKGCSIALKCNDKKHVFFTRKSIYIQWWLVTNAYKNINARMLRMIRNIIWK